MVFIIDVSSRRIVARHGSMSKTVDLNITDPSILTASPEVGLAPRTGPR